ncbi:uncharacterized protein TNCV_1102651 [Trichonephila clavipes]|nr:uncharacterized protein TNCV_1102651 [Trichonephila clavipes]
MEGGKKVNDYVDQVRIRHRKCDETETGTGSSDNGSLRDESGGFDKVQRRSKESQDCKKKGSEVKRELEEKGLSFLKMSRRGRHNREDQFDPEKAGEGTTTPTSKSEQDQATGMPDKEVINNDRTRKGKERGETQGSLHSGAQRINPEFRVGSNFRIIPEPYFRGWRTWQSSWRILIITYYEIPTQLARAYLKGHLTGRALDWFEILGYRVVEDKATDYAHLKQALTEQFPVVRNRSELETRFYASSKKHNQNPSDIVYDFLKIHKILKLEMTEEKLLDHVISWLEPQTLDYVEVRHPQTTSNLLQIIDKYVERFLHRKIRGSSREFQDTNQTSCTQSCFPVAQSDGKERKEKAHISNIFNCLHLSQLASLDKNNALREIKLRLSYLQGKSTTMSVIAHQTEKEWISANKKSRQRMSQTQAEGAAEQRADRLEDAHLRAHHSCFTTSERC